MRSSRSGLCPEVREGLRGGWVTGGNTRLQRRVRLLFADASLDLDTGTFVRGSEQAQLSPTECRLLRYLAAATGPADQHELLEQVWGYAPGVRTRTVKTTVSRIRAKIELDPRGRFPDADRRDNEWVR